MRNVPFDLQVHLDSGVTTLCTCWRMIREDGVIFGFTDHDRDLVFDGTLFRAETGVTPSALASSADLSVDNATIDGALNDDGLTEQDLDAGRYDHAAIEIFRVNWQMPDQRLLLKKGTLGEVRRGPSAYQVEFRGLTHLLDQTIGRIYQYTCDAVLGDSRCGVDLEETAFKGTGTVTAITGSATFFVSGLESYADGWFGQGVLGFTSGANQGLSFQVKHHGGAGLTLWQPPGQPVTEGDSFTITAGCDKRFATCREKFANGLNFRGMPQMPGNDVITSYPLRGETNDGGKR